MAKSSAGSGSCTFSTSLDSSFGIFGLADLKYVCVTFFFPEPAISLECRSGCTLNTCSNCFGDALIVIWVGVTLLTSKPDLSSSFAALSSVLFFGRYLLMLLGETDREAMRLPVSSGFIVTYAMIFFLVVHL